YLDARVPDARVPADITAKLRFTARGDEYRFDFTFPAFSKEPPRGTSPASTPAAPSTGSASSRPGSPRSGASGTPAAPGAIDDLSTHELLAALGARTHEVETLLQQGALTEIYLPAMSAKDLALALE